MVVTPQLESIWREAQSEIYGTDATRAVDLGHVLITDFLAWYQAACAAEPDSEIHLSRCDLQSVVGVFERWLLNPLSPLTTPNSEQST